MGIDRTGNRDRKPVSEIVDTVTFPKEEDLVWGHNTHGQNVRVSELVARGLPPECPAADAYETMQVGFAAEMSERERRVVKMSELKTPSSPGTDRA